LQQTQGFAGHTLSGQPGCFRIVVLRYARAMAVGATAIASEDQLAFVARDEPSSEIGIAGQRVV
jgi:hypothetical protein